jgi:hypothetical protein
MTERKRIARAAVATSLVLAAACSASSGGGNTGDHESSVAYKLAVIDGDASEEAAFQDVIDCIMASGIKGAETEQKVGDTLVASWQASSQKDSLLEWGQALCNG